MRKPNIIGISGLARSGKSTAAKFIDRHFGYTEVAFADRLKSGLYAMFDLDPYYIKNKEEVIPWIGCSYRKLMQTLGTEWGRESINENLWVLQMIRTIQAMENGDSSEGYVISDVRFGNEAGWIRQVGTLLHIQRDHDIEVRAHKSENGIEPLEGEWIVYNNGDIQHLYHQISLFMAWIDSGKRVVAA